MGVAETSQANYHIGGNTKDVILHKQVSGMDDITQANSVLIFFPKPKQGLRGIADTGFYLNGIHLVLGFAVVGNQKINLNVIALLFFIVLGVEE